jgi:hypothetical protein
MVRRSTWIALALALALAGALAYMNREQQAVREQAQSFPTLPSHIVFEDAQGAFNRISIRAATGGVVTLALNMQNLWEIAQPVQGAAEQAYIEAAEAEIGSMRYTDELQGAAPADLGLAPPAYVVTISMKDGREHRLEIGDQTPSETGYYARIDGDRILTLNVSSIESLLLLFANPPYRETPTPSPMLPTAAPTSIEATPVP